MLHIIRDRETLDNISEIYAVETDLIKKSNESDSSFAMCENSCLWIPATTQIKFEKLENGEIKRKHSSYPDEAKIELSAIYTIENTVQSFVPADMYARNLSSLYIDAYDIVDGDLNLPADYPAISACSINGVIPCFAIHDLRRYEEDKILQELMHDLSFKEYAKALLIIDSEEEIPAALKVAAELHSESFTAELALPSKLFDLIDLDQFDVIYYKNERNIFDFDSFTENINLLIKKAPANKCGLVYLPGIADIDKQGPKIRYLSYAELYDVINSNKIESVSFDERSQLCFAVYESFGIRHSLVYEDLRSFYAKANYLAQHGIKKIILPQIDNRTASYAGVVSII